MKYRIVCVGRRSRDPLLSVAERYLERLTRYIPTDVMRIRPATPDKDAGQLKVLLQRLGPAAHVVALDERGREVTSAELAAAARSWQQRVEVAQVVFLIGGADGLEASVLGKAHERLALSRLTLPHRLALVMLLEQLYRCHTVLRGEPYHRGGPER